MSFFRSRRQLSKPASLRAFWKRSVRLTRGGVAALVSVSIVLLAAWNTGNNLLYLILGMMLSFMVISELLSRTCLSGLSATHTVPAQVYKNKAFTLSTALHNRKRFFSSYTLYVDNKTSFGETGRVFMAKVPAGSPATVKTDIVVRSRGAHRVDACHISSGFPFGALDRIRRIGTGFEFIVFPEIRRVDTSLLEGISREGEMLSSRRGHSQSFYGIREYFHGDDPRLISWKATARQGKLMLREFEHERQEGITIFLDTRLGLSPSEAQLGLFENGVTFCASLAAHYIRHGYEVELVTGEETVPAGEGESHLYRILTVLALVQPAKSSQKGFAYVPSQNGRSSRAKVLVTTDADKFSRMPAHLEATVIDLNIVRP